MHVVDHLELHDLHRLAAEERSVRVRLRLQAVILAFQGRTAPEIAAALSSNRRSVQDWVRWYNAEGFSGLEDRPRSGRSTILPREQESRLRQRLDAGARPQDGVCTLRAQDIQRILENEFGVLYKLKGVYKLLARLGYSSLCPRPRHKLSDPATQETFKKTSRRRSRRSRPPIPINASSFGSRTRRVSASRGR
jgi:transposase